MLRVWIDFVEEASAVVFVEDAGEAPGLVLEGLHVLDLDDEDVTWFGVFDFEGPAEVVDLGEIDVLHVVGAVVVPDLASGPVDAFDLDDFPIVDLPGERN